jgi:transposase InsO family protein
MPWKVSGVVEKRRQFVEEWLSENWTMTELCARHGISRQAGYNTLERYEQAGWEGLAEQSRAARQHPNQTPAEIEQQIVELRHEHMRWGPRKLKAVLERESPEVNWPAASTMGELLRREGLVVPRKKRRRIDPYTAPFAAADVPNRVWCGDFKGWRRTQDGARIDPLTISDACSRYLLRCQVVEKTDTSRVQAIFEAAFREYGLPEAIRTDNGAPFSSCAIAGLSRLAIWWMKLAIRPERIQPAHPEQNGRHERMHLTLQQETMSPMAANRRAQQRRFDEFRREFNQRRPHAALALQTPASCYTPALRSYPARVPEPEYSSALIVRHVSVGGQFVWKNHDVFLSETLRGERIALQPIDESWYTIYFAEFALGHFDSRTRTVHRRHASSRLL